MRCITIKCYRLNSPIFVVGALSDRAFDFGFRIVNPDFSASRTAVMVGEEDLREYIDHKEEPDNTRSVQVIRPEPAFKNNDRRCI